MTTIRTLAASALIALTATAASAQSIPPGTEVVLSGVTVTETALGVLLFVGVTGAVLSNDSATSTTSTTSTTGTNP